MAESAPVRGRWIPLVYYYLATVVGLTIFLVGLISGAQSLVDAIWPEASDSVRYEYGFSTPVDDEPSEKELARAREAAIEAARLGGYSGAVKGIIAGIIGLPVFFWHLRQARRKEPEWLGVPAP